jgi:endonuclease YncB( thermonuclease family)
VVVLEGVPLRAPDGWHQWPRNAPTLKPRHREQGLRWPPAPEGFPISDREQAPDGANARNSLQCRRRLSSSVTLRPQTIDRYSRTVEEVIDEVNLNLALVEDGMAFAQKK